MHLNVENAGSNLVRLLKLEQMLFLLQYHTTILQPIVYQNENYDEK